MGIASAEDLFWRIAEPRLGEGGERSTLMGSTCLRRAGVFCAAVDRRNGQLLVKLPAERVEELIEAGAGIAFAPAGRVFREWLAVPGEDETVWRSRIEEAWQFAEE